MKKIMISLAIACIGLYACNGGNSSVPAYTTMADSANGTDKTVMAKTEPGRELFQARCQACHGAEGSARNNNAANLQFSRLDSVSIVQTIENGRGTMPPFKDAIADSDIGHLAIYVKSLRR